MNLLTIQLILAGVNLLAALVIIPVGKLLWNMRTNDLTHIDETCQRIERKIDQHVSWHLNGGR